MMMRPLPIALILALVLAAPAAGATRNVRVDDDFFVRAGKAPIVKVFKGTTVQWNWEGSSLHNVVVVDGPVLFESDLKRSGSFKRKMKRIGKYKIQCSIHAPDMEMILRVRKRP